MTVILTDCVRKPDTYFDGYSRNDAGMYYKILKIGDGDYKINTWDEVTFSCLFKKQNDSVFFSSLNEKVYVDPEDVKDKSGFIAHFPGLVEGDSVAYLVPVKTLFEKYFQTPVPLYCKNDSLIKVNVLIKELDKEIKISESELRTIHNYIRLKGYSKAIELPNKIFILDKKEGSGEEKVARGKNITIQYKGRMLNDSLFDQPFYPMQFIYGTPDQVLKGINFVIKGMNKSEYIKIIVPSYLAYGESGSSNGTVPPVTPLVYEITIIDIK